MNYDPKQLPQEFDDALPSALKSQADRVAERHISVKKSVDQLSPYIIALSRDAADPFVLPKREATPNLDAIAQSFVIDDEDDTEIDAGKEYDDLAIHFDDLKAQLRDEEIAAHPGRVETLAPLAHERAQASIAPIAIETISFDDVIEEAPQAVEKVVVVAEEVVEENNEPRRRLIRLNFRPISTRARAIASFVILSTSLVLPLHAIQGLSGAKEHRASITATGESAIHNLMRATTALQDERFDAASNDFNRASAEFADAQNSLAKMTGNISTILKVIPQSGNALTSATNLVSAGQSIANAAGKLTLAANEIQHSDSANAIVKLQILKSYVEQALPEMQSARDSLNRVNPDTVPAEYRDSVNELITTGPEVVASMEEFVEFVDTISIILGENRKMRYLTLFQNHTEIRATGGFVGSFAEMDVLNGKIDAIHIPEGGTYDIQGQLSAYVAPPEPLSLINSRWEFQDANWFPDFAQSAKKMRWFYEKAGGPTTDGVIAINASLIPKLLEITGPIEMPEYGRTIDAENFLFETQKIVEIEYDQYQDTPDREEDAPKQFIGDLAPKLLDRFGELDMPQLLAVADILGDALAQKEIQLYFENNALQSEMERLGWAGKQKQTDGDYLMIVNSNLAGGKTDGVIDQRVDLDVNIAEDGRVINTLTITKTHRGLTSALFEGLNNVDYMRVYVPKGATLIEASGFEIPPQSLFRSSESPLLTDEDLALSMSNIRKDEQSHTDIWDENNKTVFGNWVQTKPGEEQVVRFVYELPLRVGDGAKEKTLLDIAKEKLGIRQLSSYTLLVQKQSGVLSRITNVRVNTPATSNVIWSSHNTAGENLTGETDAYLRFLLESK